MAKSVPQSNTLTSALPPDLNSFSDGIDPPVATLPPPVEAPTPQPPAPVPVPPPSPYRSDADPLLVEIFEELEQIVVGQLLAPFARRHWAACNDLMSRVKERVKA